MGRLKKFFTLTDYPKTGKLAIFFTIGWILVFATAFRKTNTAKNNTPTKEEIPLEWKELTDSSRGCEAMYMIRKGQVKDVTTYLDQVKMIEELFGVAS